MTSAYHPFIDDERHRRALTGQRFIVLRPGPPVSECYRRVQEHLRRLLVGLPISYPAEGHVTLIGFAGSVPLDDIQALVREWVTTISPLAVTVQGAGSFAPPFQVAILKILRTPALFAAAQSLRIRAHDRRLPVSTVVPVDQWVFHMSLAYCAQLAGPDWHHITTALETMDVPEVSCSLQTVEIVAFDDGAEYSGGVYSLASPGEAVDEPFSS